MLSDYLTNDLLVLAIIPVVVAVFWLFHAVLRFRRSSKSYVTFWVMVTGLPMAGVLLFFWSTTMPTLYSGIAILSSPRSHVMSCAAVAFLVWILVLLLEIVIQVILGTMDLRRAKLRGE